jgi:hypothetical protein
MIDADSGGILLRTPPHWLRFGKCLMAMAARCPALLSPLLLRSSRGRTCYAGAGRFGGQATSPPWPLDRRSTPSTKEGRSAAAGASGRSRPSLASGPRMVRADPGLDPARPICMAPASRPTLLSRPPTSPCGPIRPFIFDEVIHVAVPPALDDVEQRHPQRSKRLDLELQPIDDDELIIFCRLGRRPEPDRKQASKLRMHLEPDPLA